ncbi:MAG: nitroreductase [Burkholderiaceae bacterium]|jgi:nitroreductase
MSSAEETVAKEPILNPAVVEAITSRKSIRAFLSDPVSRVTVEQILTIATRAPTGVNLQPWRVRVLTGQSLRRLTRALLDAHNHPDAQAPHDWEYDCYPTEWLAPYLERRRHLGKQLYNLLGIPKGDSERMHIQHGRNYAFFDAPVGMIFTIDKVLGQGQWLDYGMFLQNITVLARSAGLDTCVQAAFGMFPRIVRPLLGIPETELVLCGMALGHADRSAPENSLVSERAPLDSFATFFD